jgi:hypothetical protein
LTLDVSRLDLEMKPREEHPGNGNKIKKISACRECKHLIQWPYCFAFMSGSGIPAEIREGKFDHSNPFPGDHGIRFLHEDSPYELSESALKLVIAQYYGQTVMPYFDKTSEEQFGASDTDVIPRNGEAKKVPANLMEACIVGDIKAATEFLARGADINGRDEYGNTPLMLACRNCHLEVVKLLLESGCDFTLTDRYSKKAIDIAEDWGYPTIVELLKAHGADR